MSAPERKCPGCGRPFVARPDHPWRPFCSERCQLIDLGAWLGERHAIPGELVPPEAEAKGPGQTP